VAAKNGAQTKPSSPQAQLQRFIDKFLPERAAEIRFAHARMKRRFPTAQIFIYDNYNFFVIGFGPTEKPSEAIFSLACQAKRVALCFLQGAKLPRALDPEGLLQGTGNQVRSVPLVPIEVLDGAALQALITAAAAHAEVPFPATGKGRLLIKSISAKQRPRR
jgi:hypothetical protein